MSKVLKMLDYLTNRERRTYYRYNHKKKDWMWYELLVEKL